MRSKTLSTLVALVVAAIAALATVVAQDDPRLHSDARHRRVTMQLQQLVANLNLTEQQKAKIKPLIEAKVDQMRSLRMDETLTPEQKETRVQSIQAFYRNQLRTLLTPDQQKKLDEMHEKNRKASQDTLTQKRKGRVPVENDQ